MLRRILALLTSLVSGLAAAPGSFNCAGANFSFYSVIDGSASCLDVSRADLDESFPQTCTQAPLERERPRKHGVKRVPLPGFEPGFPP